VQRRDIGVKDLVRRMEQTVIDLLAESGIAAERLRGAPGVYVQGAKIAALGLRIKNSCCFHGFSLNVDMDLSPYAAINPCGYAGMPVTQLRELCGASACPTLEQVEQHLLDQLRVNLS
jgi:lipoyl(octanoyl) transferase